MGVTSTGATGRAACPADRTLTLGLAALGCKREAPAPEEDKPHAFDSDATAVVDHTPHRHVVELLEPGAEPREQLRYAAQAPSRTLGFAVSTESTDEPMVTHAH